MSDKIYEFVVHYAIRVAGHKSLQVFTIHTALMNILGFDWSKTGINLPLPDWIKFRLYPFLYPTMMCVMSCLIFNDYLKSEPTNDFEAITKLNGIIVIMTFLAATFKIIFCRVIKKDLLKLFKMSSELGALDVNKPTISNTIRFCIYYFLLLYGNVGTWAIFSLGLHHDFPFKISFPWDSFSVSGFLLTFNIDVFSAIYCALCHTVVDIIFPLTVCILIGHIEEAEEKLKTIGTGYWTDSATLRNVINQHSRMLKTGRQIGVCFSKLFVLQSIYTVLHACVLIFAMVKATNKLDAIFSSIPMLLSSYAQLYIFCAYGQMMTTKFNDLTFASYNNQWYKCKPKLRKPLVLLAEACQLQVGLKGFGDIRAGLPTYLKSIQESVSYFLILKTLTGDE